MNKASRRQLLETSRLRLKKYRALYQRYLISGRHAIAAALQAGDLQPLELLVTEAAREFIAHLPLPEGLPVFLITEKEAAKIGDETTPQGIFLTSRRPCYEWQTASFRSPVLYLEQVNDPGNLGTIIRTACWFGVKQILLSPDSADPFQPKAVRASAGYLPHLSVYEQVSLNDLREIRKKTGFQLVATSPANATPLPDITRQAGRNLILAFGSEAHGLSSDLLNICDHRMTIPGKGSVESLNLGVAVAVSLYQLTIIDHLSNGE